MTVRPYGTEFLKVLGSSLVLTCALELSDEELENDGADVGYTIQWIDVNDDTEITARTGRLVFVCSQVN